MSEKVQKIRDLLAPFLREEPNNPGVRMMVEGVISSAEELAAENAALREEVANLQAQLFVEGIRSRKGVVSYVNAKYSVDVQRLAAAAGVRLTQEARRDEVASWAAISERLYDILGQAAGRAAGDADLAKIEYALVKTTQVEVEGQRWPFTLLERDTPGPTGG
ncbi:hypothetical protein ACN28I_39430 [Archangium gephyra]|uniref:hypothetical protein n=1 Tax=Archangium gephyra TaxID=48 RepID=UPI003B7FDB44